MDRPPAHGKRPLTEQVQRDLLRELRRIQTYQAYLEPDSGATISERQIVKKKLEAARYRRNMILSGYAVGQFVDRYCPEDFGQSRQTLRPKVKENLAGRQPGLVERLLRWFGLK
jgi:hypothetical protein